jgi:MFS family permease
MALPATLAVRPRRVPLLALLAANAISLVGSGLTAVALPWFVLQTTGSAGRTGLVAAAALVAALVPAVARAERPTASRYLEEIAAGLRFVRGDRLLLVLALTLLTSNGLAGPLFAVLLPVYADATGGGAAALGWSLAAFGLGSLLGALAYGAVGHRWPRRPVWLVAFLLGPAELWLLATLPPLPILVVVVATIAVVGGPINPLLVTVRHERIPPALRGRVFATFSSLAMLAQPAGLLLGGLLVEAVGFRPTVLLLATAAQFVGLALPFVPALREMDVRSAAPVPTAGESR